MSVKSTLGVLTSSLSYRCGVCGTGSGPSGPCCNFFLCNCDEGCRGPCGEDRRKRSADANDNDPQSKFLALDSNADGLISFEEAHSHFSLQKRETQVKKYLKTSIYTLNLVWRYNWYNTICLVFCERVSLNQPIFLTNFKRLPNFLVILINSHATQTKPFLTTSLYPSHP